MFKSYSKFLFSTLLLWVTISVIAQTPNYEWKTSTSNGYTYKYVTNDPTHSRFYTLPNGLTVILSPVSKQPRIQTFIAIKAGSKTDPSTHTGLAHYLEHMLFKGTDKFGSLDWDKEKTYLEKINNLYDQYGSTRDTLLRKNIYHQIDSISNIAAKYAIANEYDKMMSGMGAKGTNAFTSFEQTVYTEDIPSNVIDKFLTVQAERFRNPVFRIFHTELEAVYEEKNRSLDNDNWKVIEAMFAALFPNNNYGKQTTIGTIEHLKNPSLKAIREYFDTYYVPNNMGIIMSGDFNPDEVIKKIDHYFSYMKSKPIPEYKIGKEFPITSPIVRTVYGPTSAYLMMGYRFPGASEKDARMLDLIGSMLTNGSAGLIDLNLVKNQKLLNAAAFSYTLKDYSVLLLQGTPMKGQSLEEVRNLLLQEINNLREGKFSDNLIQGVINNYKKELIKNKENYTSRAYNLMGDFTSGVDWKNDVAYLQELSTFTKKEIVDFCNKYLSDSNYVIVYKQEGKDTSIVKVEKPTITPVPVNRVDQSPFLKMIDTMHENNIQPQWVDYDKAIVKGKWNTTDVWSVKNKDNSLFKLYYYYNMGEWNNKLLPIAASYLSYIGTKHKTATQFSEAFYQLASSFSVKVDKRETFVSVEGLQENFAKIVSLFEDLLKNCVADTTAWSAFKERLKKARDNNKSNKNIIAQGLIQYASYGAKNPFNNQLSNAELDALTADTLVTLIHKLLKMEHKILYYGNQSNTQLIAQLQPLHLLPKSFLPIPAQKPFVQTSQLDNQVLYTPYDMVQAEIYWVRNENPFVAEEVPVISLFNNYFGGNMASIVFQTIRESKALAYSTYASYRTPAVKDDRNSMLAYVGTQADKFNEATQAMNELLDTLPNAPEMFNNAKTSLKKSLASERIVDENILTSYITAQRLGLSYDIRKKVYEQIPTMSFETINQFHQQKLSHKPYTYCIVAGEDKINPKDFLQYGNVKKLTLEEIFGY